MIHTSKLPDDVFKAMVAEVVKAFPEIGKALAVGGPHAEDVLGELHETIGTRLRQRAHDL
jgi:hypothetical protein